MRCQFILFPQIVGLILTGFLQLLSLIIQTEDFLIQIIASLGDFLLLLEKASVIGRHLLLFGNALA